MQMNPNQVAYWGASNAQELAKTWYFTCEDVSIEQISDSNFGGPVNQRTAYRPPRAIQMTKVALHFSTENKKCKEWPEGPPWFANEMGPEWIERSAKLTRDFLSTCFPYKE